jgi:lipopolysaccharide biosynthesis glycosyltransferase
VSFDERPAFAACFDHRFVPHAATMLRSVAETAVTPGRWYLVGDESVTPSTMRQLLDFARARGLTAEALHISGDLIAGLENSGRYPPVAFYRAVLADALPHEDRLIYIDCDVLVLHDLKPLWETSLGDGHYFGAVRVPSYGGADIETARLRLPPGSSMFYTGVMLMDLVLMRSEDFGRRTRDLAASSDRPEFRHADQDALNMLFTGRWTPLDPIWNCSTSILLPYVSGAKWADDMHYEPGVLERAARSPAIVHFEGAKVLRPWHRRCFNPFTDLYRYYRSTTPWPLRQLEGSRHDDVLSHVPPRVQAKFWYLRHVRRLRASH